MSILDIINIAWAFFLARILLFYLYQIARGRTGSLNRTDGELNGFLSSPKDRTYVIGRDILNQADNAAKLVKKDNIYREFHKKHMNRITARYYQAFTISQAVSSQKPAGP